MEARPLPRPPITPGTRMTEEEYLAFEATSEEKHEYWNGYVVPRHGWRETEVGELVAMAGASPNHNQVTGNLAAVLNASLRKRGCRIGIGDRRVRMPEGGYVYPDLVFACDRPHYDDEEHPPVLLNPTLIVEVLSPSTSERDRGTKLRAYTRIESVQAYWIVEQDEPAVTLVERQPGGWGLAFATGLDGTARSEALDLAVALAEVYALVDLPPAPPTR